MPKRFPNQGTEEDPEFIESTDSDTSEVSEEELTMNRGGVANPPVDGGDALPPQGGDIEIPPGGGGVVPPDDGGGHHPPDGGNLGGNQGGKPRRTPKSWRKCR